MRGLLGTGQSGEFFSKEFEMIDLCKNQLSEELNCHSIDLGNFRFEGAILYIRYSLGRNRRLGSRYDHACRHAHAFHACSTSGARLMSVQI